MRRGDETVCLIREEGSFPIRSFVLGIGRRFPLGVGSAGLAMIAHLPAEERERSVKKLDLSKNKWGARQSIPAIRDRFVAHPHLRIVRKVRIVRIVRRQPHRNLLR